MMDEHQLNWKEMANIMMKINKKQRKCSTLFMLWIRLKNSRLFSNKHDMIFAYITLLVKCSLTVK